MADKEEKNLHAGHRQRILCRFVDDEFQCFAEHEIIEMYLFGVIPRANTNEIAHSLINKFGSAVGVLKAPYEELIKVSGIGSSAAKYIKSYSSMVNEDIRQQYTEDKIIQFNILFTLLDLYFNRLQDKNVHMFLKDKNDVFAKFIPLPDDFLTLEAVRTLNYMRGYCGEAKYCTFIVKDRNKLTEAYLNDVKTTFEKKNYCLKNAFYITDYGFQSYFNPNESYNLYIPTLNRKKKADVNKAE